MSGEPTPAGEEARGSTDGSRPAAGSRDDHGSHQAREESGARAGDAPDAYAGDIASAGEEEDGEELSREDPGTGDTGEAENAAVRDGDDICGDEISGDAVAGDGRRGREEANRVATLVSAAERERCKNASRWNNSLIQRRKSAVREIQGAETRRRQQLAAHFGRYDTYWQRILGHLESGKTANRALVAFFKDLAAAHTAYAVALKKVRVLEEVGPEYGEEAGSGADERVSASLGANSLVFALRRLSQATTEFGESVEKFGGMVRRDLAESNIRAMAKSYAAEAKALRKRGAALTSELVNASKRAVDTHKAYAACFERCREGDRTVADRGSDLWLLELRHKAASEELERAGSKYLNGMAELFNEAERLEQRRASILSSVLGALLDRTRALWQVYERDIARAMKAVDAVDAHGDLVRAVRGEEAAKGAKGASQSSKATRSTLRAAGLDPETGKQAAAAAEGKARSGAAQGEDGTASPSFPRSAPALSPLQTRPPLESALVLHCADLRRRSGMMRLWRTFSGVLTCDGHLHVLHERALAVGQLSLVTCVPELSLDLKTCGLRIAPHVDDAAFELVVSSEGMLWNSVRTHTFKCASQEAMVDWMVALQPHVAGNAPLPEG